MKQKYWIGLTLLALFAAAFVVAPGVQALAKAGASRSTYFARAVSAMQIQGDRRAEQMLRDLGAANPTVPPALSSDDYAANRAYAAQYTELRRRLRQAILHPAHAPEHQWRVDRAEADLHIVAHELSKGRRANISLVQRYLTDANWALDHQIVPYGADAVEAPTANITANPSSIMSGAGSTVTWTTSHADQAAINGKAVALSGNMNVTPTVQTTYNLVATGESGQATDAATIIVMAPPPPPPPAPTAWISAEPSTIERGRSTTVKWDSENANKAEIDGATVALRGSMEVSPNSTRSYDLVARGPGGRATASTTVTVTEPPPPPSAPAAQISVSPSSIERGQCATLSWNSTDATEVTIEGRNEALDGSREVCPTLSQSYDMVATGPGGRATSSAFLTVVAPPSPTADLSANANLIYTGECSLLTWNTENATKITLDGDDVAADGTKEVCPTATREYELVATGPGGKATDAEIITVTVRPERRFRIHFDFDESVIRPDAVDTMMMVARIMRDEPDLDFLLEGHCDAKGSEDYNMELGMRRAESVRDFFVQRFGISPTRLSTVSQGEAVPIAPNAMRDGSDHPEGRQMNRRAEFIERRQ